jgi:hypothetical protein
VTPRVQTRVVVDALHELADAELQRRRWTATQGPEIGSFVEAMSRLLDDSGLGDALDRGVEVFGNRADRVLAELADQLSRIDGSRTPDSVLADPRMSEVRRLSAAALALIDTGAPPET